MPIILAENVYEAADSAATTAAVYQLAVLYNVLKSIAKLYCIHTRNTRI